MISFSVNKKSGRYLQKVATRHGSGDLNIKSGLFDQWLTCLISAVSELDQKYDPSVGQAWRIILAPGIEYMKDYAAPD